MPAYAVPCALCDGTGTLDAPPELHAYGDGYVVEYLPEPCPDCDGTGLEPTDTPTCYVCGHSIDPHEPTAHFTHAETDTTLTIHKDCL